MAAFVAVEASPFREVSAAFSLLVRAYLAFLLSVTLLGFLIRSVLLGVRGLLTWYVPIGVNLASFEAFSTVSRTVVVRHRAGLGHRRRLSLAEPDPQLH